MANKKNRAQQRSAQVGIERRRDSLDEAKAELGSTSLRPSDILAQAKVTTAAHEAKIRESLEDEGRLLVDEQGVPQWTVRVHHKIGHLGGFVVWALLAAAVLPAVFSVIWAVLVTIGVTVVAELPATVLGEIGASAELVSSRTDSFLFSWVMPVMFFVLIFAGVTLWVLKALAQWLIDWGRRLALGLFAGYGMGPVADWKILRARRAAAAVQRAGDRRVRDKELADSISAEAAVTASAT